MTSGGIDNGKDEQAPEDCQSSAIGGRKMRDVRAQIRIELVPPMCAHFSASTSTPCGQGDSPATIDTDDDRKFEQGGYE